MTAPVVGGPGVIEWAWAGRALEGPSGDLHVVVSFPGGALVALLDGLGHGPEAAAAVREAAPVLEAHAHESVLALVQLCHASLRKTRGAVMSLASFNVRESSLTWAGIGNVEAVVLRARTESTLRDEAVAVRGGVVGFQLPPLRADTIAVRPGDLLIMASDGIRGDFADDVVRTDLPSAIAESILGRFATGSDDAHVVVVRYVG